MTVREVKVCGLNAPEGIAAAVAAGATHVGFIFYPPSPRAVSPERAGELARGLPGTVKRVAVLVDPSDAEIAAVVDALAPDILQLHGSETPERLAEIRARFGIAVMKAIRVSNAADIEAARAFDAVADALLFDAKPPKDTAGTLPGGNGVAFDWTLLAGYAGAAPWFLSGGLDAENVGEAARISGARAIDVSSGVEDRPGAKNTAKIAAFLKAAHAA